MEYRQHSFLILMSLVAVSYLTKASTDCKTNYTMSNGYAIFTGQETTVGMTVPVKCQEGYELEGATEITCQADGRWSNNSHCIPIDCGNSYWLENGYANFTGRSSIFGSLVPVFCDEGYQLHGDQYATCLASGNWTQESSCQIRDCGTNYEMENGHVHFRNASTLVNDTFGIHCNTGYTVKGDDNITCLSSGHWSRSSVCQIVDCGVDLHIENGRVQFENHETTYASQIPVFCNTGYTLVGDNFTVCQADAFWTGNTTCQAVDCGTNYSLQNGQVNFTNQITTYNQKIKIECVHGTVIEGDAFITCLSSGEWSDTSHCVWQDCGANYELENGYVNFTDKATTYHEMIQVTCNEGYDLVGEEYISCRADGLWSKETTCQIKDCGSPDSVANGYAEPNGETTFNNTARVTCQEGYENTGDMYITCGAVGQWSTHSQCQRKDCGTDYHIEHGFVDFSGHSVTYDSIVPFTCYPGYETDGQHFIHCMSTGNWSSATCRPKDCGSVYNLENGHAHFAGGNTTYRSTIPIMCNEGYETYGQDHIQCGEDGTWTGPVVCRLIDCKTQYTLENGYANFENALTTFNEAVTVSCVDGYELDGEDHIFCQSNGTWTTTACKIKDCGSQYGLDNGYISFNGIETTYGEEIPVMCDIGYYLEGDENITCLANGSWSKNSFCYIQDCGTEYNIDGGQAQFTNGSTTYNFTVAIECYEGYNLHGDGFAVCMADGSWSRTTECIINDCGINFTLPHGHVEFADKVTTFNSTIPVVCGTGYVIYGEPDITCLADGWSNGTSCLLKDCGSEYALEHGFVNFTNEDTTFNSTVLVDCDVGYIIDGDPEITCTINGWNNETSCNIVDCGTHYTLLHGRVNFTGKGTTYNESIPVTCELGYTNQGQGYITCLHDGRWSEDNECIINDCGTNYTMPHGHVNFTGKATTYNESIPVTCELGYAIHGQDYITCLHNGSWSDDSECIIKDCGNTFTIAHGHVNFTGELTTYNHSVSVSCARGYELNGDDQILCLSDGKWSNNSACTVIDCGTNFYIQNGQVSFTDQLTTYNESLRVVCDKGYIIQGEIYTTCLDNGSWTQSTSCDPVDCGDAYVIQYGHVNFTGYITTFNNSVPVQCNIGHYLQGDSEIICTADGTWSRNSHCPIVDCGTSYSFQHGYINFTGHATTFNHSLPIICNEGYEPTADHYITCQADGTWDGNLVCDPKDCGDTYTIDYGHVNFTGYITTFNNSIPVHCNMGHYLQGDSQITCTADGTWSKDSQCPVVDCGTSYPFQHGFVNFTGQDTIFNHSLPIICNEGYEPTADHYITCQADGNWTGHLVCDPKDCGNSYPIDNGYVNFTGQLTTFNHTVAVACNEGYTLEGDHVITCLSDGTWSTNVHCQPVDCGAAHTVGHGYVNFTGRDTTYNNTIPISCDIGYIVNGTNHITCMSGGTWESDGECLIIDCGSEYNLTHGKVDFTGLVTTYNAQVPVSCNEGYEIEGVQNISCLATGAWSQTSCKPKPLAAEEDNTAVIVGATVGGVAVVVIIASIMVAFIKKKGLLCFAKSYSLNRAATNSAPVPKKTVDTVD